LIGLPRVIGHRGIAGLAPENTLAGFRAARRHGVEWVEFDVRLTADRRCVLMHDETIERTTGNSGPVAALTLDELGACDAGSWYDSAFAGEPIPTLEEAIDLLDELGLGANIELKPDSGDETALAEIAGGIVEAMWPATLPPPLISSFSATALAAAQVAIPALPRGLLIDGSLTEWRVLTESVGASTVHARHDRLSRARVSEIQAAGYPVLAYTVNHAGRYRELQSWGVAAVFSDRPDRLLGLPTAVESTI
jgi:glycerophosphoryl diester phosphodiesterase